MPEVPFEIEEIPDNESKSSSTFLMDRQQYQNSAIENYLNDGFKGIVEKGDVWQTHDSPFIAPVDRMALRLSDENPNGMVKSADIDELADIGIRRKATSRIIRYLKEVLPEGATHLDIAGPGDKRNLPQVDLTTIQVLQPNPGRNNIAGDMYKEETWSTIEPNSFDLVSCRPMGPWMNTRPGVIPYAVSVVSRALNSLKVGGHGLIQIPNYDDHGSILDEMKETLSQAGYEILGKVSTKEGNNIDCVFVKKMQDTPLTLDQFKDILDKVVISATNP